MICCLVAAALIFVQNIVVFAANSDSELQTTIDRFVDEYEVTTAAMSVAVFNSGDVLFEQAYGYINIAENRANNFDAVFEWGSVGKLLVYVSILQLVEQGLINLHADIRTVLPDGFLTKLSYDEPIAMIHLLNHTAGFQESFLELVLADESQVRELGEALKLLQPPQIFRPGEVTAYSNFSTALAGYIVEHISGMPFHAYVHEYIFTPLGMTQTALRPDLSDNPWVRARREQVQCYTPDLRSLGTARFIISWYPAGKATGTISDFRKFGQALLPDESGTTPLFQNPETLRQLHSPTSYYPDGITGRFYHGFWGMPHLAGHVIGHGGNTTGMSAMLLIDLENGFGAVVLTNQGQEQIYNCQLMTHLFGIGDFSQFDNSANDAPISGIFRDARGFERGIFRPLDLISIRPIFQQEDGTLHFPFNGTLPNVVQGVYWMGLDLPMFPMQTLIFSGSSEDETSQYITVLFTDYIRTSWEQLIFEVVSLLLFAVAGLYGLVTLIRMLIVKIRKRERPHSKLRGCICAASLLALVNLILFIINTVSLQVTLTATIAHGVLFILLTAIITSCVLINILRMKIFNLTKEQKRQRTLTSLMGAFVIMNVIYWQLWMFWI